MAVQPFCQYLIVIMTPLIFYMKSRPLRSMPSAWSRHKFGIVVVRVSILFKFILFELISISGPTSEITQKCRDEVHNIAAQTVRF